MNATELQLTKKAERYLAAIANSEIPNSTAQGAPGRAHSPSEAQPLGQEPLREPASPVGGEAANSDGPLFLTVDMRSRREIASGIDLLIGALDDLDGDADLEEQHDAEPDLDAEPGTWQETLRPEQPGAFDEDLEPMLGACERHPHGRGVTGYSGYSPQGAQSDWADGSRLLEQDEAEEDPDREEDPAEMGIGDGDGLQEQAGVWSWRRAGA